MQRHNTFNSSGNGGDRNGGDRNGGDKNGGDRNGGDKKRLGKTRTRVPKKGPGLAALEESLRQHKRLRENAELRDGNQCSSTLENSLVSPSNFQVLPIPPPFINVPQGVNSFDCTTLFPYSTYNPNIALPSHANLPPSNSQLPSNLQPSINSPHGVTSSDIRHSGYNSDIFLHSHANLQPSNFQVPPNLAPSINGPHGVSNFNSTALFRDSSYNSGIAVHSHANLPLSSAPLFSDIMSVHPRQVTQDQIDSYQHAEPSGPRPIPFYDFMGEKDTKGVEEDADDIDLNIDLNLKL